MKVAIVYASTTGNTEKMALLIKEGAESKGAETYFSTAETANSSEVLNSDVVLLGSPAMGDEVLEDSMEDFFTGIENSLKGKKVGIFGSYDWGDGQWLRDWADRLNTIGAVLVQEPLAVNLEPSEEDSEKCRTFGEKATA